MSYGFSKKKISNYVMSTKKQLIDPLGAMFRLISLNLRKGGTKIRIHDHAVTVQKPNNYQGLLRWVDGDSKEDIGELFMVIVRIIKWYLIPAHKKLMKIEKQKNQKESEKLLEFAVSKKDSDADKELGKLLEFAVSKEDSDTDKESKESEKEFNKKKDLTESRISIMEGSVDEPEQYYRDIQTLVLYFCEGLRKVTIYLFPW